MTKKTYVVGFPRIGESRELKIACENYWAKKISKDELENVGKALREKHWKVQYEKGVGFISSNDFSYYDNMLDTLVMVGAIPERYQSINDPSECYFAMARGIGDIHAMEMRKYFNTNYHFIVPELTDNTVFKLNPEKIINEYKEAKSLGIKTKINIIGPLTFLSLSKYLGNKKLVDYIDQLLNVYVELINELSQLDDEVYLQIEEPIFVKDSISDLIDNLKSTYNKLTNVKDNVKIIFTTYYENCNEAIVELKDVKLWGIALDFVYGNKNLDYLKHIGDKKVISGIVDGRNIWINDLNESLEILDKICKIVPKDNIILSTSCSLLHSPYSIKNEYDSIIKKWLSFSVEKIDELLLLERIFFGDRNDNQLRALLSRNRALIEDKIMSDIVNDKNVTQKINDLKKNNREGEYLERKEIQKKIFNLPLLPLTTIGSFPQTKDLRKVRSDFKSAKISYIDYESEIKKYIDESIKFQEELGFDVLVHGEPERNDMVEYFGELLNGFHFTKNGWVQSYGSRCVKPPIIFGDVSRPNPMTVKWIKYAQSKTDKIMKGMLTGPVTMINWSFVRNDVDKSVIAKQIAICLKEEIEDLQSNGIKIIQVDEAAFKEGYPLRKENISKYEKWALESFNLAVSSSKKETQIHTHMCYSDFNDIINTIEKMDFDVISIETVKSGNRLLDVFQKVNFKKDIGPGVYDVHSPRIPTVDEFKNRIYERLTVLPIDRMWVNPDCGLKTRNWEEVKSSLSNLIQATKELRK